ncbi:hypothetical protein PC111_g7136 [Phytophthora cactorum]|nr:hypothetical protein PC111_g7136 [Phytophthora cactorum]
MMKEELDPAQEIGDLFGDVPTNMTVVKVPRQEALQAGLWLVSGSIDNALDTKGIRFRVYRLAGAYLGYCDPVRRIGLCTMKTTRCRTNESHCCATISGESVSEDTVNGSRYKVNLIVRGLNAKYAKLISMRLKEGFVASEDR